MTILFVILLTLVIFLIAFFVLIQNPKGGGMDSAIMGGMGNQIFGVQQSTNILEKGTWILGIALLVLCLTSPWFIGKNNANEDPKFIKESEYLKKVKP